VEVSHAATTTHTTELSEPVTVTTPPFSDTTCSGHHYIRIGFNSVDELRAWAQDDSHAHVTVRQVRSSISQEGRLFAPVLPKEYGAYSMELRGNGEMNFFYNDVFAPRIKERAKIYEGDSAWLTDYAQGIHICVLSPVILETRTWEEYLNQHTESWGVTFNHINGENAEIAYYYSDKTESAGGTFIGVSSARIFMLYDGKYAMSVHLFLTDKDELYTFLDELRFEYLDVPRPDPPVEVSRAATTTHTAVISTESEPPAPNDNLSAPKDPTVDFAIEILCYVVGLPSELDTCDETFAAALIVSEDEPGVDDAIEVLKWVVGLESAVGGAYG
jgi:hypothetical protein